MERARWLCWVALALVAIPLSLAAGRWGRSAQHASAEPRWQVASQAVASPQPQQTESPTDVSKVAIENLGTVAFDEAYELLRSASHDALVIWTRRLEGLPVGPRRTAGITAFFKTLAQIDARTAVDLALSIDRQDPRWTAIGAVGSATPAANLHEVARMYSALNEKKLAVSDFIDKWSRSDPVKTAEWISGYAGLVENRDIASLMTNWAAVDPTAAREWLARAGADRLDPDVYAGFYTGWVEAEPALALKDLAERGDDEIFKRAIETVAEELFKDSPEAARTLVFTLQSGAPQQAAVRAVVHDVTAAYIGGGPDLKTDEVANWLLTLPQDLWDEGIGEVLRRWRWDDPAGEQAWLEQLPLPTRDAVLAQYCRAFRLRDATEYIQAGLRIHDPQLREQTFRAIFRELEEEQRGEFLSKLQLSDDEARELGRIVDHL